MDQKRWLSVADITEELGIPLSTWEKWRKARKTPEGKRLPNGTLRFDRAAFDAWLDGLEAA